MKKLVIIGILVMIMCSSLCAKDEIGKIDAYFEENQISMPYKTIKNQTYLGLREMAQLMALELKYDTKQNIITLKDVHSDTIVVDLKNKLIKGVRYEGVKLPINPLMIHNKVYLSKEDMEKILLRNISIVQDECIPYMWVSTEPISIRKFLTGVEAIVGQWSWEGSSKQWRISKGKSEKEFYIGKNRCDVESVKANEIIFVEHDGKRDIRVRILLNQ
ncbi:MAG: hypothetical protein ACRCTE_10955, partial [Cellulosilyticaceae bacterium]